jgi:uncharacterized protein YebE (UPF0316 family)
MVENVILAALIIFAIRVLSIAIGTLRVMVMGRARSWLVGFLALFESLMFVFTFGAVAQNLDDPWAVTGYCLGFAVGTIVGTKLEERMGQGYATVNIISKGSSLPIAEAIRKAGYGATRTSGEGQQGTHGLVWVVIRRKDVEVVFKIATEIDPNAFLTVNETRRVSQGFLGYGRS